MTWEVQLADQPLHPLLKERIKKKLMILHVIVLYVEEALGVIALTGDPTESILFFIIH